MPTIIPLLKEDYVNTFIVWTLIALLKCVEDIWKVVTKVRFRQSKWHRWVLTYITKHFFTHFNNCAAKNLPFKSNTGHMMSLDTVIAKTVSFIISLNRVF